MIVDTEKIQQLNNPQEIFQYLEKIVTRNLSNRRKIIHPVDADNPFLHILCHTNLKTILEILFNKQDVHWWVESIFRAILVCVQHHINKNNLLINDNEIISLSIDTYCAQLIKDVDSVQLIDDLLYYDGINIIHTYLTQYRHVPGIMVTLLTLIERILIFDVDWREEIFLHLDMLYLFFELLVTYMPDPYIVSSLVGIFVYLATNDSCEILFHEKDILSLLFQILHTHQNQRKIVLKVLLCMANCTHAEQNIYEALLRSFPVESIVHVALSFAGDTHIQTAAMIVIANFCICNITLERLMNDNNLVILWTINNIKSSLFDNTLILSALRLLYSLFHEERAWKLLRSLGVLSLIKQCLVVHATDFDVIHMCKVLCHSSDE